MHRRRNRNQVSRILEVYIIAINQAIMGDFTITLLLLITKVWTIFKT